jgi:hypothetical protein
MRESDPQPPQYPWQQFVLDAFMEFRPEILPLKVSAAERAISARLRQPNPPDPEESAAIRDALRSLSLLFPEASRNGENSSEKNGIA